MTTILYDAAKPPDPTEWLALDDHERIRIALNFHVAQRAEAKNLNVHAALHVVVENQAAESFGPTIRALARLQEQGLSRHEAIHAIASVLADHFRAAGNRAVPPDADSFQAGINAAIEQLDTKSGVRRDGP